jgi:hypothetical protein
MDNMFFYPESDRDRLKIVFPIGHPGFPGRNLLPAGSGALGLGVAKIREIQEKMTEE